MNRNSTSPNFFTIAFLAARSLIRHPRSQFAANWRRDLAYGLEGFDCLKA
jgi:hypothetical protein